MNFPSLNKVRIIAGRWRGRKITFPSLPNLRPTHDRIRETLFNWLSPVIGGAVCLDLFAGSGALGFEALSRAAAGVTFVDNTSEIIASLRENARRLEAGSCEFIRADVIKDRPVFKMAPFDIVFLDPPFNRGLLEPSISWLESGNDLKPGALIYIETEEALGVLPIPATWVILRQEKTRSLRYYLLKKEFKT